MWQENIHRQNIRWGSVREGREKRHKEMQTILDIKLNE